MSEIAFTPQQLSYCKTIMKGREEFEDTSKLLYASWVANGWVPDIEDTTYEAVWNNTPLKKATLLHLAEQLSTDLEDISKFRIQQSYGCGFISPFDLYFNCQTDKLLNDFINTKKLKIELDQYNQLKLGRNRLVTKMANLRRDVFEAIGLPGTPSRSYPPIIAKEIKKKALMDRSGVQDKIASITGDLSTAAFAAASAATEAVVDMDEQDGDFDGDDDGDCDEDGLQSLSGGSIGEVITGKRKAKSLNKDLLAGTLSVQDFLIAKYPAIQTSGIVLVINDGKMEAVDLDCATCSTCKKQLV